MDDQYVVRAREAWASIHPRIKHMGDVVGGTHAEFCVEDIATALRELGDQRDYLKSYLTTVLTMHVEQLSKANEVVEKAEDALKDTQDRLNCEKMSTSVIDWALEIISNYREETK